ncbi:BTB/POZ domain-containing protein 6-like isoform X2 [Paramacrobiotus metropolitanus]|uniref:BTB/POZ domain-containing protein 6-like isoform X2 n=1 Tax=Paramacrobiotus metropolitanus TaxID=2943436 RepID=UPI00244603AE|nr:BTB/POZ domain-containing protein 6-like isoform X2 [Paramacrobiotus metropolitanus]
MINTQMTSQNLSESTPHERRDPFSGLYSCTKETLVSGDLSDVQFSVGGDFGAARVFKAHKYIVSIRSPVFYRMFYGSVPEKGPQVDIPDCIPDAFANMLSCMYTDAVDKDNLTMDNVFPTIRCADKYDLPQLTAICSDFVAAQLNAQNCIAILEQAVQWQADHVVEECLQLVEMETDLILRSESFTTITHDILKMILQRRVLSAEENVVYMAVDRWAVEACKRNGLEPSGGNCRQVLSDALFLVRFPLLSGPQLATGPGKLYRNG